ncbi:MAG: peptidoglycan-binding domain-containing protein [Gaiellaceae bacterium]
MPGRRFRGQDPDDWFAQTETGPSSQPPVETASSEAVDEHENWLVEEPPARRPSTAWPLTSAQTVAGGGALVLVLIVALAIGGAFSGSKPKTSAPPTVPTTTATTTKPTAAVPKAPTTTLKPGDSGAQVRALQRTLGLLGYAVGTVDGTYGPATQKALASFQTAHGLAADGVLGPKTLAALTAALAQLG